MCCMACAGALFLFVFLWWGAACISTPYAATSYKHHRRVWTATATAALLLFLLQLLAQLLYGLHVLPAAPAANYGVTAAASMHSNLAGNSSSTVKADSAASIAAVVLEALGLGSMDGLPVGYILLVSAAAGLYLGASLAPAWPYLAHHACANSRKQLCQLVYKLLVGGLLDK